MSRSATLYLDHRGFRVFECEFNISKPTDYIGHPTGEPSTKSIIMMVEDSSDKTLLNWARSDSMVKSGHVFLLLDEASGHHRTYYFMGGFCSSYRGISPAQVGQPNIIEMKLTVEVLSPRIPEGYSSLWSPEDEKLRKN